MSAKGKRGKGKRRRWDGNVAPGLEGWDLWLAACGYPETTRRTWVPIVRRAGEAGALADHHALAGWLGNPQWKPTTRRAYTVALMGYLKWARSHGWDVPNPKHLRARRPNTDPLPKALSASELHKVMSTPARPDIATWLRLALGAGLRAGEIARLTAEDVDLVAGTLLIRGKGGKQRTVPLHPDLVADLARWPDRGSLWPGVSPQKVSRDAHRHFRRAGIHHGSIHRLRHTHATQMLEAGADIVVIQRQLGHASLSTTQVYITVRPERQRDAVLRLTMPDPGPIYAPRRAFGQVTKIPSGRWHAHYRDPDGRRRSRTFDTEPEASQWLETVHAELDQAG